MDNDARPPRHSCTHPQTGGVTARRPPGNEGGSEEERAKGPSIETLRTRLLTTKALRTALIARHERVRSAESRAELDRSHVHVRDAEDALAQATQAVAS